MKEYLLNIQISIGNAYLTGIITASALCCSQILAAQEPAFNSMEISPSSLQQTAPIQELPATIKPYALRPEKNEFLAVGFSLLFPGLGHTYLGDLKTAGGLAGTAGTGLGVAFAITPSTEAKGFIQGTSFLTVDTCWYYGIYSAYRDARIINGQSGYRYKMPTDSFQDLLSAPFSLQVMKKPEVWGGILGSLALAFGITYLSLPAEDQIQIHTPKRSLTKILYPFSAIPVGIGEESLFRGFLQPLLSEWLTPWGGICLSSALFGLAHVPNGRGLPPEERKDFYRFIIPFITATSIYDGWLAYKNQSIQETVAIHMWYDFVLFALSAAATKSITNGPAEFAISFSF